MDEVSNILLPDGWEADGEWHGCSAFKHDEFGWLTVNFESRTAGTGLCVPRRDSSLVPSSAYKGRGWKQQLVTDAIAAAERLWRGDPNPPPETGASQ